MTLVMPAGWHRMVAGDPAWTTIYGADAKSTEQQTLGGTLADFALPLDTPDSHLLSLAIYVEPAPADATLATLGEQYAYVLNHAVLGAYGPGKVVGSAVSLLSAGLAVRLDSTMPYSGPSAAPYPGLTTRDDHVVAYVLEHGGRGYYLVFRGNEQIFGHHTDDFGCIAASLRFTEPTPSESGAP
jgi:hypothetical protein